MSEEPQFLCLSASGLDCKPVRKAFDRLIEENASRKDVACEKSVSFGPITFNSFTWTIQFAGQSITAVLILQGDSVYVLSQSRSFITAIARAVARPLEGQIVTHGKHIFLCGDLSSEDVFTQGQVIATQDVALYRNKGLSFFYTPKPLGSRDRALTVFSSFAGFVVSSKDSGLDKLFQAV